MQKNHQVSNLDFQCLKENVRKLWIQVQAMTWLTLPTSTAATSVQPTNQQTTRNANATQDGTQSSSATSQGQAAQVPGAGKPKRYSTQRQRVTQQAPLPAVETIPGEMGEQVLPNNPYYEQMGECWQLQLIGLKVHIHHTQELFIRMQ